MVILDVRSKREYDDSHVEGSIWFDVERLIHGDMPDLPKDEKIITYCRTGARSTAAMYKLRAAGFLNAENGGSLANMAMSGYQIVR